MSIDDETVKTINLLRTAGVEPEKVLLKLKTEGIDLMEKSSLLPIIFGQTPSASPTFQFLEEKLSRELVLYADPKGNVIVLARKGEGNTVEEISDDGICRRALPYLWEQGIKVPKSKVIEVIQTWKMKAPATTEFPPPFSLDRSKLAFNHVDIELLEGPTPVFDDFIKRCGSNGKPLMAFIWSIFNEDDKIQQYVLMRGDGRDGKGSLLRLIERLVGPMAYQGMSPKDPYWVAKLVGKRVAFWPDVNSTAFVMSSEFKAVTGGDRVTVTEKYQKSYSAVLGAKIFISTNNAPEVTSRKSDARRVILVEISPADQTIPDYEDRLWGERSEILFKCKAAFEECFVPSENVIKCSYEELESRTEDFEVKFSSVLDNLFEVGSSDDHVVAAEKAYSRANPHFKMSQEYSQFTEWLKRKHRVQKRKLKDHKTGRNGNFLVGIKLKFGGGL